MDKELELEYNNIPVQSVYPRANFSDRAFAFIVDGVIVIMIPRLLSLILGGLIGTTLVFNMYSTIVIRALLVLVSLLIPLWYFSFYQYKHNGQTLGKRWNKVKVTDLQGNDVNLSRFVFRTLIALVPLTIGGSLGYLWLLTYLPAMGKERRALHDYIVGTQVISIK